MIGNILRDVADLHQVTVADIRGGRRFRDIVAARHAAIWVLRQIQPGLSEQRIAEAVGLSDHSTVVYALQKIDRRVAEGDAYAANLCDIVSRHKGEQQFVATVQADHRQRLPGSPDRWALWNAAKRGTAYVETA